MLAPYPLLGAANFREKSGAACVTQKLSVIVVLGVDSCVFYMLPIFHVYVIPSHLRVSLRD